jgi:hypothetical protein
MDLNEPLFIIRKIAAFANGLGLECLRKAGAYHARG